MFKEGFFFWYKVAVQAGLYWEKYAFWIFVQTDALSQAQYYFLFVLKGVTTT